MPRRQTSSPPYLPTWYVGPPSAGRVSPGTTITGADGMRVTFEDGSEADDWSGAMFVNNIGLGRPEVADVLADQVRRLAWATPDAFADVRLALARDLRTVLPPRLSTVHYGVGGSDCMEAAVRAARKVTGRKSVLVFSYAYHGDTLATESLSDAMTAYGDPRPWVVRSPSVYELWEHLGDWEAAYSKCLEAFDAMIRRSGPRTLAAVITESVSGSYAGVPLRPELAAGLRETCDGHGIKLVADEVITGFGRTGEWWGSTAVGLEPDAMVFAKGITGGYAPLGAAVFEQGWGDVLRRTGFPHGLTFSGHPLGCAAARETIRILKDEDLVSRAKTMGRVLRRRLVEVASEHPEEVRDVRGIGLLQAMELRGRGRWTRGKPHPAAKRMSKLRASLRRDGLMTYATPDGSSLLLCPSLLVTREQIDSLGSALDRGLRTLEAG